MTAGNEHLKLPPKPGEPRPATRKITFEVDARIPEATVRAAINTGMQVVSLVEIGRLVILFPQLLKDAAGQPHMSIGSFAMVVRDPKDMDRVLSVAEATNTANVAAIQAESGTLADKLTVDVMGEKLKDNTAAAASAAAGRPKIIIP